MAWYPAPPAAGAPLSANKLLEVSFRTFARLLLPLNEPERRGARSPDKTHPARSSYWEWAPPYR
jgi:hypothetical protein